MLYEVIKENGYISAIVKGINIDNANCSEEEYLNIKACLINMPIAPQGFCYRLSENLEWQLCEAPLIETDIIEETDKA